MLKKIFLSKPVPMWYLIYDQMNQHQIFDTNPICAQV